MPHLEDDQPRCQCWPDDVLAGVAPDVCGFCSLDRVPVDAPNNNDERAAHESIPPTQYAVYAAFKDIPNIKEHAKFGPKKFRVVL